MRTRWLVPVAISAGLSASPLCAQELVASEVEVQAFVAADLNGDGLLTQPEFRTFVRAMARAGQSTARQIRFFGAYAYAFDIADADGNGVVNPMELRQGDDTHRAGQ